MNIEIYTIPGCSWCDRAVKLMEMANITDYKKYVVGADIDRDIVREKFPEVTGYPVISIDEKTYDVISAAKLFVEKGLVSSKKK